MKLTVGTRGSKLSLIQTENVIQKLREENPEIEMEVQVIKTIGDEVTSKPLISIKEKGIFEKEIDKAVLRGDVDIAVHSMKDLPTIRPHKTIILAVPERESLYDALVSKEGLRLKALPNKAIIGTGSPRRKAQVLHMRPDIKVKHIRGNVDTRVRKLTQGLYDAIILAEAGLQRLDMQGCITERLSLEDFTPAPGQGALAIVARQDDKKIIEVLKPINHWPSMASVLAERSFIKEIGGGCRVPLGAFAQVRNNRLSLHASVLSPNGKTKIQTSEVGDPTSPDELGFKVAQKIMKTGAVSLIQRWRTQHERG
ncbi:MAG: hydroxymethylbilane synthase [Candidatus Thorarchaeota archaeon]|nr:hydroxymethylbilane synthase [Candidatus Thorarchaeota archaeon]